jgi:hypothetical protein
MTLHAVNPCRLRGAQAPRSRHKAPWKPQQRERAALVGGLCLLAAAAAPAPAGARAPSSEPSAERPAAEARPEPRSDGRSETRHAELPRGGHLPGIEEALPRLRPVLKGALFRSGTPSEPALAHLCETGWKRVYSLYGEHTTQAGPRNQNMLRHGRDLRTCQSERGQRTLEWRSAPSARMRSLPAIFADVLESVRSPDKGPVLVHCWNGLHYAGMVSALALRQFCGFTAEQAEAYWRANANRGANYPLIIDNLYKFKPIANLTLSAEEQAAICPDPGKGFMVTAEAFTGAPMSTRVAAVDPSVTGPVTGPGTGPTPAPAPALRPAGGQSGSLGSSHRGSGYIPPKPTPLDSARRATPAPGRGSEPAPSPSASSDTAAPRNAALPSTSG